MYEDTNFSISLQNLLLIVFITVILGYNTMNVSHCGFWFFFVFFLATLGLHCGMQGASLVVVHGLL